MVPRSLVMAFDMCEHANVARECFAQFISSVRLIFFFFSFNSVYCCSSTVLVFSVSMHACVYNVFFRLYLGVSRGVAVVAGCRCCCDLLSRCLFLYHFIYFGVYFRFCFLFSFFFIYYFVLHKCREPIDDGVCPFTIRNQFFVTDNNVCLCLFIISFGFVCGGCVSPKFTLICFVSLMRCETNRKMTGN